MDVAKNGSLPHFGGLCKGCCTGPSICRGLIPISALGWLAHAPWQGFDAKFPGVHTKTESRGSEIREMGRTTWNAMQCCNATFFSAEPTRTLFFEWGIDGICGLPLARFWTRRGCLGLATAAAGVGRGSLSASAGAGCRKLPPKIGAWGQSGRRPYEWRRRGGGWGGGVGGGMWHRILGGSSYLAGRKRHGQVGQQGLVDASHGCIPLNAIFASPAPSAQRPGVWDRQFLERDHFKDLARLAIPANPGPHA